MMLAFFKHKKFWLPVIWLVVLFLLTELILRLGFYDKWVKPNSYLGNAIYREQAIKQNGLDKIQWIAIGNSRFDWGIDQKKFTETMESVGIDYKRMSFESSNFIAMQATIDWSIAHMDNLEGVILGVSQNELSKMSFLPKQMKIAWPFRRYIDLDKYHIVYNFSEWEKYLYQLAWISYFPDIKSFLRNPTKRFKEINKAKNDNVLIMKRENPKNLCEYEVKTIQQCVSLAQDKSIKLKNKSGYSLLKNICSKPITKHRAKVNKPMTQQTNDKTLIKNWTTLIQSVLNSGKHLTFVILPEHQSHQYIFNPSNDTEITQSIIDAVKDDEMFELVDLRNLFENQDDCQFFSDPLHFNNQGITIFTNQLLNSLMDSFQDH